MTYSYSVVGNSSHAERNSAASMGHQISDRLNRSYSNISSGQVRPDTWRTWSIQRAGISNTEFEGLRSSPELDKW